MEQELKERIREEFRDNVAHEGVDSIRQLDLLSVVKRGIIPRGAWTAFTGATYDNAVRWCFHPIYKKKAVDGGLLYSANHLTPNGGVSTVCGQSLWTRLDLTLDRRGPGADCKTCASLAKARRLHVPPALDADGVTRQAQTPPRPSLSEESKAKADQVIDALDRGDLTFNEAALALIGRVRHE